MGATALSEIGTAKKRSGLDLRTRFLLPDCNIRDGAVDALQCFIL